MKHSATISWSEMTERAVIELRNIGVTYPNGNGGLEALKTVEFRVRPQEFICILGPSGCGKTTLLRVLAGLIQPTSGEIWYEGVNLRESHPEFGLVFQKANLMPWRKVSENISLPLELQGEDQLLIDERVASLVRLVGLVGFENWLPRDLSGGMAQRVAIARALAHDPEVLLLDEPFGQLDALTREQLAEELLGVWQAKKKTVLMVTHAIDEAIFLADRVIVLSPQPGQVRLDLGVDFARPRGLAIRYTEKFGILAEQIRKAIERSPSISAR